MNVIILENALSNNIHERTFLMLKPDTIQRGLVGKIIQRLENKGLKLVAIKIIWVNINFISKMIG